MSEKQSPDGNAANQGTSSTLNELTDAEIWWRDHSPTLEAHGYKLRARFIPGWIPSWSGTNLLSGACEDGKPHYFRQVVDAKRVTDGKAVMIKNIRSPSKELDILEMFSSPETLADRSNYCVPVLDHFVDLSDPDIIYFVMPFLRAYYDPPFLSLGEVVEFMSQILKGLEFIHKHGVAHRDCFHPNIMMDATPLYPKGFHPVLKILEPDFKTYAVPHSRSRAPVKYYFIDFGISSHFNDSEPRLVLGSSGIDRTVPELSDLAPYDPFPVDIYVLGNVFDTKFLQSMTQYRPQNRPSASEALKQFRTIASSMTGRALRWQLREFDEERKVRLVNDFSCYTREGWYVLKWVLNPFKWKHSRTRYMWP